MGDTINLGGEDRKKLYIDLFDGRLKDTSLQEQIYLLTQLMEKVPEEHRPGVQIYFSTDSEWDDHYPTMQVCYERLETDEEMQERHGIEMALRASRKRQMEQEAIKLAKAERELFESLKLKYENKEK